MAVFPISAGGIGEREESLPWEIRRTSDDISGGRGEDSVVHSIIPPSSSSSTSTAAVGASSNAAENE